MRNPGFKIAGFIALLAAAACGGDDKKDDGIDNGGDGDSDTDNDPNDGTKPTINSFKATLPEVRPGTYTVLNWSVTGASSLKIDGVAVEGSSAVVSVPATKTFQLTATNSAGDTTATVAVTASANPNTVPTATVDYFGNTAFQSDGDYVVVPASYNTDHSVPMTLFVWLHGCGGTSEGDIYNTSPSVAGDPQSWITLAPYQAQAEGACWNMESDPAVVLTAIANIKTHFNIDPRKVILGGYSSGGDLSYRIAFYNALSVAGISVTNTSPFRDTGSTQQASLAAAAWKFNIYHLPHLQDEAYPYLDYTDDGGTPRLGVKSELQTLVDAAYPVMIEPVKGTHYDKPNAVVDGTAVPGTDADIHTKILAQITKGWQAQ